MTKRAAGIASLVQAVRADRRAGWALVAGSLGAFGLRGADATALKRLIRAHVRALPRRSPGAAAGAARPFVTYSRRTPEPRPAVPGWHRAAAYREWYAVQRKYGPRGGGEPIIHDRGTATQRRKRNERLREILRRVRPTESEHRGVAWEDDLIARYNVRRYITKRGRDGRRQRCPSRAPGAMVEVPCGVDRFAGWLRRGERWLTPHEQRVLAAASPGSPTRRRTTP